MSRLPAAAAAIAIFSLSFAISAQAQTVPQADMNATEAPSAPVVSPVSDPAPPSMVDAILRARRMLQDIVDARSKTRKQPYPAASANTAKVTFAVWNRKTDAIALIEAAKSGTGLAITSGPILPIKVTYNAKLYSQYALPASTDSLVVGVIYPVISTTGTGKRKKAFAADTVYVPYDPAFYTPEMLGAGSDYLSFLIQQAYDEMRAKGIRSRAFPDKLVVDVIDPYLVKSIAVIEHSDHQQLLSDDDPERTVGRFLVKLAANRDSAFDASISTAGAAGLVQFIPSTYALMVRKRPDLGLIPDFRQGMADHQNAVKAQVAYLDEDLAGMSAVRELYVRDKAKAAEFLAASYNGGSVRVKRAYTTYGEDWAKSYAKELARAQSDAAALKKRIKTLQKNIDAGKDVKASKAALAKAKAQRDEAVVTIATINRSSLRKETVFYVAKLKKTYAMFTAGYFATPRAPSGALPAQAVPETPAASEAVAAAPSSAGQVCFSDGGCAAVN
ncbi:MAG: hypothetical protein RL272_435 [Candidatus Parcubacteria bacterium]